MDNEKIVKVGDNGRWDKILLKKTNVDNEVGFDFHLSPLKWTGVIFAISAVFLPFLLSIIWENVFEKNELKESKLNLILLFTNFILILLGMFYIIKAITPRKFLESGAVGFYLFYFLPKIALIIVLMFIGEKTDNQTIALKLKAQLTAQLTAIVLIFVFSPSLRLRFRKTFKENFPLIMAVVGIGFAAMIGLNVLFSNLDELINGKGTSQNQTGINEMKSTSVGTILMFFLTVTIAPFIEELACRHSIFSLSGNKWLAFFTSVIYFAGMHVESAGDWNKILIYMSGSIVLTLTFLYVRGNVTYVIFLHMLYNTFAFIMSLIPK